MNRLLATSELAGIPVTARLPADRSQSSGVVQGVDGDYTDEALLAAVSSDVPVIAARRQGTSLVLRFASPVPPTRVRLFRMVFERHRRRLKVQAKQIRNHCQNHGRVKWRQADECPEENPQSPLHRRINDSDDAMVERALSFIFAFAGPHLHCKVRRRAPTNNPLGPRPFHTFSGELRRIAPQEVNDCIGRLSAASRRAEYALLP
ncbi:hypothetical protein MRX96_033542 [Rhipicephalus microplus]